MTFTHPAWLIAGPVACVLMLVLWHLADRRQRNALTRFVAPQLREQLTRSISVARRRLQRGLFLLALLLLCAALAGPLLGFRWENVNRRGNEIVFAIDTSRSMATPDVKPDRLTRAKLAIDDFTHQLDGDAVGIVAFAGSAFLVCPITLDYGAFYESLSAVDTHTIPRGGTNIASAIHEAQAALRRRPGSDRILILVTDGEDLEGSALTAAESAAHEDGLKIYTVGVGTAAGDLIPLAPEQGGGFVKDEGSFVKSRLDEAGLKAIAEATGGFYVPLGNQGEGLETLYKNVLGSLAKHDLASRQQRIYTERYQWPLAASLATLLLSLTIGNRRRVRPTARPIARATIAPGLIAAATLIGALGSAMPPSARAQFAPTSPSPTGQLPGADTNADGATDPAVHPSSDSRPPAAAGPGANAGATKTARKPSSTAAPIQEYNAGTAAYRAGQFPAAEQAFQQSIAHAPSDDPKRLADQEDAYYNLGNTLYRNGQKTEQSSPQDTLKKWNDAVKAYETALQLRSDDADSKYNRDLVKRKIAALQQKQPPQNNDQNKDKNKGGGQGQGQGGGQGQGQGQGQGGGQGQPPPGQQPPQTPPPQQGQPPQGQPPPQGQSPQGQSPQGQPPQQQPPPAPGKDPSPPAQQQPPGQPPPNRPSSPSAEQPAGAGQPPGPTPKGDPHSTAQGDPDQAQSADERAADNERQPGQMSREEARELLDSVKGDEKHAMRAPIDRRDQDDTPDKPIKDW